MLLLASATGAVLVAEWGTRVLVGYLPAPVVIYLHPELKAQLPEAQARVGEFNPWAGRRQRHPKLGWIFAPGETFSGVNEAGQEYTAKVSASGFVTPDQPPFDDPPVVTLGDSFMATYYVPQPIAWVMREALGRPVYNLAVAGWGPDQYRAAFERYATGHKAPVVVVFTFNNDITDVDNWRRWRQADTALPFMDWLWQDASRAETPVNRNGGWLDQSSVLWNWVRYAVTHGFGDRQTRYGERAASGSAMTFSVGRGQSLSMVFNPGYNFLTRDPAAFTFGGSYWSYMERYFEQLSGLREAIESTGARMVLVWIPTKEEVYLPVLKAEKRDELVRNLSGRIDGIEGAVMAFCRRSGMDCINLRPPLAERARDGAKLYFTKDGHLNNRGNTLVGRLVARHIESRLEVSAK